MPTRDDLHDLAALTAFGLALGLAHLVLRPGLPLVASPPAVCDAAAPAAFEEEPTMSVLEDAP